MQNFFDFKKSRAAALPEKEKLDWLRLARAENVGPITFNRLLEYYGSADKALEALPELARKGGRKKPLVAPPQSEILREYEALRKIGGDIITAAEEDYPAALAALDDAPPVLSYIGRKELLGKSSVAIVGARNASINGRKFTQALAADLGKAEQVVTSGLARGIDTAAHQGALASGTIAVVAGGIDIIYPEENKGLYEAIAAQGLIIAESPLSQQPFSQSFPRRNRIVSGLSKAVIVVEATLKSGSLITARLAGEQGRELMAVPGHPMDPRASGPNHLIREGATLIRSAHDVLEALMNFSGAELREPYFAPPARGQVFENPAEIPDDLPEIVLQNLSLTPLGVDELLRSCHVSVGALQTALLELDLAGRIRRLPGNRVCLTGEY